MQTTIEATDAGDVSDARAVRDFDELDDRAQTVLDEAAGDGPVLVPEDAADSFTDGEVVRFTGYYRVTVAR